MRIDLIQTSVETIYFTIWASPNISLHMGKIENADETWRKHVGIRLQVFLYPVCMHLYQSHSFYSWYSVKFNFGSKTHKDILVTLDLNIK